MRGQLVEGAVIGLAVHAPEPRAADVGQARAELVAEEMEDAEDRVGVGAGVGHDLGRLQLGLLLQHDREQGQAVAQGAGHGDAVQAGELVGDEVVERDPALLAEVARVRPGVDGADRHHEAQPVGGCDVAAAPGAGERDAVLGGDQAGIGPGQGLGPDVVLPHPAQPRAAQRRVVAPDQRLEARCCRLRPAARRRCWWRRRRPARRLRWHG